MQKSRRISLNVVSFICINVQFCHLQNNSNEELKEHQEIIGGFFGNFECIRMAVHEQSSFLLFIQFDQFYPTIASIMASGTVTSVS